MSDDLRLQALIAGRKSRERESVCERERECVCERERDCTVFGCLHTNLLFWLGFLEYRNTMIGSVNQSSDEDPKPKLIVRIGFCTAKLDIPQY